jgi:hypothetical protein
MWLIIYISYQNRASTYFVIPALYSMVLRVCIVMLNVGMISFSFIFDPFVFPFKSTFIIDGAPYGTPFCKL